MNLTNLLSAKNRWLINIFILYIVLIFLFAIVYYIIYRTNSQSFAFNADLLNTKSEELKLTGNERLNNLYIEWSAVNQLVQELTPTREPSEQGTNALGWFIATFQTSDYRFEFEISPRNLFYSEEPHIEGGLTIYDKRGNKVAHRMFALVGQYPKPLPMDAYENIALNAMIEVESDRKQTKAYWSELKDSPMRGWSFLDFLYFSTITQTTVGYGDILPNRTLIRMIVSLQIILGLLILGVVLNFAISEKGDRKPVEFESANIEEKIESARKPKDA